jgi:hypothetical protein
MEFLTGCIRLAWRSQVLRLDGQVLPHGDLIASVVQHLVPNEVTNEARETDLAIRCAAPGPLGRCLIYGDGQVLHRRPAPGKSMADYYTIPVYLKTNPAAENSR